MHVVRVGRDPGGAEQLFPNSCQSSRIRGPNSHPKRHCDDAHRDSLSFRVRESDESERDRALARASEKGIGVSVSLLLKRTLKIAIEGTMEGQGTPDQSQAGPGEPTRDIIRV